MTYPRTFQASGPVSLSVSTRSGRVRITATESTDAGVDIQADEDSPDIIERISVSFANDALRIEEPRDGLRLVGGESSVDIHITVPQQSTGSVETGSADVILSGGLGDVSVSTGSGDINAENCGDISAETGSGDVSVNTTTGAKVRTGSGDVVVEVCSGNMDIVVASGDIVVGETRARAYTKTASGDIRVKRAVEGELTATTASGDIEVGIASGTAAKLDCSSVTGRVTSDLDGVDEPGDEDRTVIVSARAVSGDVAITRAN